MFDEQPDGDVHGECAAEIRRLQAKVDELTVLLSQAEAMIDEQDMRVEDSMTDAGRALMSRIAKVTAKVTS